VGRFSGGCKGNHIDEFLVFGYIKSLFLDLM